MNRQKSEIFCNKNVSSTYHNIIVGILGVRAILGTRKYLGLPFMICRSKKETFSFIKDQIWKKINSWSNKCFSKVGREVLIKPVLQFIPSYFMCLFTFPWSLCDEIEKKKYELFLVGHSRSHSKGINWFSWDKLSIHNKVGGISFKSLGTFNLAMLGKQGWRNLTHPDTLISRMYKARYFS